MIRVCGGYFAHVITSDDAKMLETKGFVLTEIAYVYCIFTSRKSGSVHLIMQRCGCAYERIF